MQNVINQMVLNETCFDNNQILDYFKERAFNVNHYLNNPVGDQFLEELFTDKKHIRDVALLTQDQEMYHASIQESIPVMPTMIELKALKSLLSLNDFEAWAGTELFKKMEYQLADVESYNWKAFYSVQGIQSDEDTLSDNGILSKINIIMKAIQESKTIQYSYTTNRNKHFDNQIAIPYKILYSLRTRRFQLILVTSDMQRPILQNIRNLSQVMLGEKSEISREKIHALIDAKKHYDDPLVLEVEEKYGAVERCFTLFSYYHKEAFYDAKTQKHTIKIYYYDFDESELIRDILSLGDAVVVRGSDSIRTKVLNRIKAAYNHYKTNENQ